MVITANSINRVFPKDQLIGDGRKRQLTEDYVYVHRDQFKITIKEGFTYDGCSIPRILWPLSGSPFTGNYMVAALVHDSIYATHLFSRDVADEIFYEIMRDWGIWWYSAYVKWAGVHIGGGGAWDDITPEKIKQNRELVTID